MTSSKLQLSLQRWRSDEERRGLQGDCVPALRRLERLLTKTAIECGLHKGGKNNTDNGEQVRMNKSLKKAETLLNLEQMEI